MPRLNLNNLPSYMISLIAGVLLAAVGLLSIGTVQRSLSDNHAKHLDTVLRTSVTALEMWIESQKTAVQVRANEPRVRELVEELVQLHRGEGSKASDLLRSDALQQLRDYLGPMCRAYGYIGFVVTDRRGVNVGALLDEPVGQHRLYDHSDFLPRVLEDRQTLVCKPFPGEVDLPDEEGVFRPNRPTMFVSTPVFDQAGGVIAALSFRIRPERDFTRILSVCRPGKTGETYAFDHNGLMLSDSRYDEQLKRIGLVPREDHQSAILNVTIKDPGGNLLEGFRPTTAREQQPLTRMADSATRGGSGLDSRGYRDYRGVLVIGAWTWLDPYGFGIASELNLDEAYAPLQIIRYSVLSVLALLLVATAVGVWLDHRKRQWFNRVQEGEAQLRGAMKQLENQKLTLDEHAIVSIADIRGDITYTNDKFCEISGYTREELIEQNHWIVKSDEHDKAFYRDLWKTISSGNVWHGEIKNTAKDGSHYWVDATLVPFKDEHGKVTQYVAIHNDITEIKKAQDKLRKAAEHDRLTGLPNRELFVTRLQQAIRRAEADPDFKFAVLFFDFDRFKVINDSLGHNVGDALLIDIARQFEQVLRHGDMAARFGGDEFIVLLNDLGDYEEAYRDADRLLKTFAKPHDLLGYSVTSTASIGLVTNAQGYTSAEDMVRDADAAMYQAKEAGKARVVVFDQAMHEQAMDRLTLEGDLRSAVSGDQLRLLYQPIIELGTGELSGFEALIRWEHPERGTVSPVDFIPIAEDTGLIIDIGKWVLQTASRRIADWNRRLSPDRVLSMNVNISKRQLLSPSLVDDVLECQRQHDLHSQELKLEITESVIVDDRADVVPRLRELREHGFPIVMDDFGTGVSSLSTLHDYPIDVLKIDQSFIRVLDNDRSLLAVVASITSLAENLGIQTVAEGIETQDIVGALQSIDCTWGQGYHFAKPLTAADAEAYLLGMCKMKQSA